MVAAEVFIVIASRLFLGCRVRVRGEPRLPVETRKEPLVNRTVPPQTEQNDHNTHLPCLPAEPVYYISTAFRSGAGAILGCS